MTGSVYDGVSEGHAAELRASAIAPDVAAERGYRTITNPRALHKLFQHEQRRLTGLEIPIYDAAGSLATVQLKADHPRTDPKTGKPRKYETASGGRMCLDVPRRVRPLLADPHQPLWITEGAKKVDSGLSNGIRCIIGVLGVYNWRGTNAHGGKTILPDFEAIAWNGRDVVIAYDSDVMRKETARPALARLGAVLTARGATVRYLLMPDLPDGSKRGLDDHFAAGGTRAELRAWIVDDLPTAEPVWDAPVPVATEYGLAVPIEALSHRHAALVRGVSTSTQTPAGLAFWASLGIAGAATRGRYHVAYRDWRIPGHIQTLQLLPSGGGKSPAYRYLRAPLDRVEQAWAEEYRDELREWKVKRKRLETIVRKAKQAAEKVSAGDGEMLSLEDAERMLMQHDDARPIRKRIILDDATPQAAWNVIDKVKGAAAYISDEGGPLRLISRYSDDPIFDPWIKGFDGSPHPIDRKTDDEEKIIPRPILAVSIAAQPQPLEDMGQMRGFRELGVAARLIFAILRPVTAHDLDAPAPDPDALAWWERTLTRICLADEGSTYAPAMLALDADAEAAFREERAWHQARTDAGDFADMAEWGRKYPSHVLRVAGILHVIDHDNPAEARIGAGTIGRAVTIMRPMIRHAWIAHSIMFGGAGRGAANDVLDAIRALATERDSAEPLTVRMVHRKLDGRVAYREVAALDAPLAMLERCGWIRLDRQTLNGSRRPSGIILCNPCIFLAGSEHRDNRDNKRVSGDIVPIVPVSEPPRNLHPLSRRGLDPTGTDAVPEVTW